MAKKELDPFYYVDGMSRSQNGHSIPFARLSDAQAKSRTYQKLKPYTKCLYMTLKLCRQYHMNEKDVIQGDVLNFTFSRSMAKQYGFSNPNTTRAAMIELVNNGFITVTWNGWAAKKATIFRFSDGWKRLDKGQDIELSAASRAYIQGRKKKA